METKKYKLSEISLNVTDGEHGTVKDDNNGNYFLLSCKNIKNGLINITSNERKINEESFYKIQKRIKLEKNDVLITTVGTIGEMAIIEDENINYCFQRSVGIIKPNKELVNPYFLYYSLRNELGQIATLIKGAVQKCLFINDMKMIEVSLPDLKTQNKMVKVLQNIDKKIKLNDEINNNLYEMCNVLYHQLLDDNESNIEYKTIGEIAKKVITGKTPSTKNKEYWDGNIPFITIPDMHNQVFTINTERYITNEGAKSLIPKNSISVSCIATVGLVSINDKVSQTNQQINSIVIENDYDLYYLFEFLTEQEQYMKSIAGGSTTYNINKNTFENIQVPYLNKELIIEYDKKVRPMFEKIKSNQISNDTLSQLRDILLPKLMNGEIDLDNIEI